MSAISSRRSTTAIFHEDTQRRRSSVDPPCSRPMAARVTASSWSGVCVSVVCVGVCVCVSFDDVVRPGGGALAGLRRRAGTGSTVSSSTCEEGTGSSGCSGCSPPIESEGKGKGVPKLGSAAVVVVEASSPEVFSKRVEVCSVASSSWSSSLSSSRLFTTSSRSSWSWSSTTSSFSRASATPTWTPRVGTSSRTPGRPLRYHCWMRRAAKVCWPFLAASCFFWILATARLASFFCFFFLRYSSKTTRCSLRPRRGFPSAGSCQRTFPCLLVRGGRSSGVRTTSPIFFPSLTRVTSTIHSPSSHRGSDSSRSGPHAARPVDGDDVFPICLF
mmetsp:Transcript_12345/g.40361  ORF Transcript_12345/g.40361 Transcript_12345/m.40361 type:complete len:330 (-) Transcript_12345:63-1052(-)